MIQSHLADLVGPARKDLVLALKERGPSTAEDLAAATYLSIAATRSHLLTLERSGMVTYNRIRGGVGRPTHLYRLTDRGELLFPQCYTALGEVLLEGARGGATVPDTIWQAIEESQMSSFALDSTGALPSRRVARIAQAFETKGFAPHVTREQRGEWRIELRHCPLVMLARRYPELCETERRIVRRAAGDGAEVEYVQHRGAGSPFCTAVLRWMGEARLNDLELDSIKSTGSTFENPISGYRLMFGRDGAG